MKSTTYLFLASIFLLVLPRVIFMQSTTVKESIEPQQEKNGKYTPDDPRFYISLGISLFLCLSAGICSGLSVCYLSIDKLTLELKIRTGSEDGKKAALVVLPIIEDRHLLLSTLLIANSIALEALPIFMETTMSGIFAVILSTICVVIFSEILPQSFCTGPSQLIIAMKMAPLVKILNLIFGIISIPLGKFLDNLLGKHENDIKFQRRDLKALISLHQKSVGKEGILGNEETQLITSTIDLRQKTVGQIKIPIEKVFSLHEDDIFGPELISKLLIKNYSKIPVFNKANTKLIGFIKAKSLIDTISGKNGKKIKGNVDMHEPLVVASDTSLFEMLRIFQEQKASLAVISEEKKRANTKDDWLISRNDMIISNEGGQRIIGLVALNDIFEELMNKEFEDSDVHQSLNQYFHLKNAKNNKKQEYFEMNNLDKGIDEAVEGVER